MRKLLRWTGRLLLVAFTLGMGEALLLRHPGALFAWSYAEDELSLHSDRPFTENEARAVLAQVRERLGKSGLYRPGRRDAAYLCNSRWRRLVFFVGNYRASGLNYAPLTTNVFLRGGRVGENRLVSPSGQVVAGEMTLANFIVHEIAHSLTVEQLGVWAYHRTPSWLQEAYADYVARGSVFARAEARAAYLADAPEMNWPPMAPYLRYNLLFGQLVEHERRSPEEVLASRIPQAEAERRLRMYLSAGE